MHKSIKVTRRIHNGWIEWIDMMKSKKLDKEQKEHLKKIHPKGFFGKYQFIYKSKKGEIDMISIYDFFKTHELKWEIYSRNTIFQDTYKFDTKKEAENKIEKYLKVEDKKVKKNARL